MEGSLCDDVAVSWPLPALSRASIARGPFQGPCFVLIAGAHVPSVICVHVALFLDAPTLHQTHLLPLADGASL